MAELVSKDGFKIFCWSDTLIADDVYLWSAFLQYGFISP